jgi:ankyrin repeat protein
VRTADVALMALLRAIGERDDEAARRLLADEPELALASITVGATREDPGSHWFDAIEHYVYEGDTALHLAAAANDVQLVETLLELGAAVDARNRRGAQPLHYACDGGDAAVVDALVAAGADPNATDKSGVAPLHRAVRNRRVSVVRALLDAGADPNRTNGSGSSPMTLATNTTGKSGSGSPAARERQAQIVELLRAAGAT